MSLYTRLATVTLKKPSRAFCVERIKAVWTGDCVCVKRMMEQLGKMMMMMMVVAVVMMMMMMKINTDNILYKE